MEFKASKDIISNIPDDVVPNILDRLPIQDAVRTCILSKNWRFKWTMLTQLVFDEYFFQYLLKTGGKKNYRDIISWLFLRLKVAITKFVLSVDEHAYSILDYKEIKCCILFLSRNGIKDFTIRQSQGTPLWLPIDLFSSLGLKHLKLFNCVLMPPFSGFPNLLSLELDRILLKSIELGKIITQCPLLEMLNMRCRGSNQMREYPIFFVGKVKLVEIATLANLKILSLSLSYLENTNITNSSCIFELVGCLPKLQQLDLDFWQCKFTDGGVERRPPTTFPCLKVLKLTRIDLGNGIMLSCAFELVKCFPNLQSLEITTAECDADPPLTTCSPEVEYSTVGLLQLRIVVFRDLKGLENEMCLIKYLLACSPSLRKIAIHPHSTLVSGEKLFTRKLLKLHRASPVAEIDLY